MYILPDTELDAHLMSRSACCCPYSAEVEARELKSPRSQSWWDAESGFSPRSFCLLGSRHKIVLSHSGILWMMFFPFKMFPILSTFPVLHGLIPTHPSHPIWEVTCPRSAPTPWLKCASDPLWCVWDSALHHHSLDSTLMSRLVTGSLYSMLSSVRSVTCSSFSPQHLAWYQIHVC